MQQNENLPGTNRIEAFSDGVIAIIITIMVFEIKVPEMVEGATNADVRLMLLSLLPKLIAYTFSFIVIAIMWLNHHALFHQIKSSTSSLIWYNANLLFWMSLIPLPTAFIANHPLLPEASLFYGLILGMCGLGFTLLRYYASVKANLLPYSKRIHRANIITLSLYFSAAGLSYFSVYLSFFIFILIPAIYFMPELLQRGSGRGGK